jgi:hypothetical protein
LLAVQAIQQASYDAQHRLRITASARACTADARVRQGQLTGDNGTARN